MYKVEVSHIKDFAFKAKSNDSEFIIDVDDRGISPPAALLASLGSCIGVYLRKYAEGSKLAINGFVINISAELTKETPHCFKLINVEIDLKGLQLDQRRRDSLLAFIKNCPVHNTLKAGPQLQMRII